MLDLSGWEQDAMTHAQGNAEKPYCSRDVIRPLSAFLKSTGSWIDKTAETSLSFLSF